MGKPAHSAEAKNISWCSGPNTHSAMTAFSHAAVNAIARRNSTKSLVGSSGCSRCRINHQPFTRTYGKLSQEFPRTHLSKVPRPTHVADQRRNSVSRCRSSGLGNSTFAGKPTERSPLKKCGTDETHSCDSVQAPSRAVGSMAQYLR